jgi:DNA replication regulator DPB11
MVKSALASAATQMGADHKFDLTSDVTHLIVGGVDTSKYKYVAKERPDVKVVLPAFVNAVKESWMKGGGTDVEALELEYRVPTFHELRICVTGFESQKREEIIAYVNQNGAEYHGDLTRKCTHLIAATARGSKYDHARKWGVTAVGQEWMVDSIERGMSLDETLYDPLLAPEDRGRDAWKRQSMEAVRLGKRQREVEKAAEVASNKRKLRRTMSAKLGSQHDAIWADIASASSEKPTPQEWHAPEQHLMLGNIGIQNVTDSTPDPTVEPLRKETALPVSSTLLNAHMQNRGLFGNSLVYVHGFTALKEQLLADHLESHGAQVGRTPNELEGLRDVETGYLVIPHDKSQDQMPPIPAAAMNLQRVTEWWVESCIMKKKLVDPTLEPLCRPFAKLAIDGMRRLIKSKCSLQRLLLISRRF